jgi:hypothetical protein
MDGWLHIAQAKLLAGLVTTCRRILALSRMRSTKEKYKRMREHVGEASKRLGLRQVRRRDMTQNNEICASS